MTNDLVVYEIVDNKKDATNIRHIGTREYKENFGHHGFPKSIIHTARRRHLILPEELKPALKGSHWSEIRVKDKDTVVISYKPEGSDEKESFEYPLEKVLVPKRDKVLYVRELVSFECPNAVIDWLGGEHDLWWGNYIFGVNGLREAIKRYAKNREMRVFMASLTDKFENNKAFIALRRFG